MGLSLITMKKQRKPAIRPMISAGIRWTNPDAGLMTTRPATAPEMAPRALGLPLWIHSATDQLTAAAAAAKCVATKAEVASELAFSADPALNPNHPTQSRHAPIKLSTIECGGMAVLG